MNDYRLEPTGRPGEYERVDCGPTDISATLTGISEMINETYTVLSAIMRFIYGENPARDAVRNSADPPCFAAALMETKGRASEMTDLAVMLAKRMGA